MTKPILYTNLHILNEIKHDTVRTWMKVEKVETEYFDRTGFLRGEIATAHLLKFTFANEARAMDFRLQYEDFLTTAPFNFVDALMALEEAE